MSSGSSSNVLAPAAAVGNVNGASASAGARKGRKGKASSGGAAGQDGRFATPQRPSRSPSPQSPASAHTAAAAAAAAAAVFPSSGSAPGRPDLAHLVGRPLVPFFLSNGEQNVGLAPPDAASAFAASSAPRDWAVSEDGRGVQVRQFVDGYFVNAGVIGQQQQQQHSTPRSAPASSASVSAGRRDARAKREDAVASSPPAAASYSAAAQRLASERPHPPAAASAAVPSSSSSSSARFAAPAFTNSPSPLKVPLPKFLKDRPAAAGAGGGEGGGAAPPRPSLPEEQRVQAAEQQPAYLRGPSLLHLLQPASAQGPQLDSATAAAAPAPNDASSLLHFLSPTALDAAHSSNDGPDAAPPSASSDVPQLLFLRQSSVDDQTVVTHVPLR